MGRNKLAKIIFSLTYFTSLFGNLIFGYAQYFWTKQPEEGFVSILCGFILLLSLLLKKWLWFFLAVHCLLNIGGLILYAYQNGLIIIETTNFWLMLWCQYCLCLPWIYPNAFRNT